MGVYPLSIQPMRPLRSKLLRRLAATSILASLSLAAPSRALGAEPTPSELSVARRLFDEGKAAFDAGRWQEAAGKFRQATAIKDTPGMRFHLARCEEEQGALVEALVEYDRAQELMEHGAKAPDVERLLPEAREKVKAKIGQLVLRLPADTPAVTVELDGKAVLPSVLSLPLPVNPGTHRLRATAAGRQAFSVEVTVPVGGTEHLTIDLPPDPQAQPAAPVTTTRPAPRAEDAAISGRSLALAGEATLFVAAVTTGVVFQIKRGAAADRYASANRLILAQLDDPAQIDSACHQRLEGCEQLVAAEDDRSRAGTVAAVAFVAAGASAVAFGLTYWLWPQGQAPVDVRVGAAPRRLGLTVSGSF